MQPAGRALEPVALVLPDGQDGDAAQVVGVDDSLGELEAHTPVGVHEAADPGHAEAGSDRLQPGEVGLVEDRPQQGRSRARRHAVLGGVDGIPESLLGRGLRRLPRLGRGLLRGRGQAGQLGLKVRRVEFGLGHDGSGSITRAAWREWAKCRHGGKGWHKCMPGEAALCGRMQGASTRCGSKSQRRESCPSAFPSLSPSRPNPPDQEEGLHSGPETWGTNGYLPSLPGPTPQRASSHNIYMCA